METISIAAKGLRLTGIAAGQGPLVLMLHGFPETAQSWRHQVEALGRSGYRALAINLPGFADSDRPASYRLDALVEVLINVLDAWGKRPAPSSATIGAPPSPGPRRSFGRIGSARSLPSACP